MGDFVSGDRALALLVALNGWIAWRYSRVPLGQDEGLWMLWGWTGAVPYRDHIDCKPPGIQLWLWLLAKLTRRNIAATRAITHLAIGAFAVAATAITGELAAGLLFTAIAQSSLLLAYHAWVEPLSAGFLLLALVSPPWVAAGCLGLAMLFNLKLGPPGLAILLIHGWWLQLAAAAAIAVLIFAGWRLLRPAGFRAVWFGVVELPRRMTARRKSQGHPIVPHWTPYFSTPLLLMAPALGAAIAADRHAVLWIPCALYMGLNLCGRVWRPYHWIPVAAFAAAAAPAAAPLILLAEWCASGLYLGNVERSARPRVAQLLEEAERTGIRLREVPGALWVDAEFTQIYVYARKRPARALVEQVEIRHVVADQQPARAAGNVAPDLVVFGPQSTHAAPRSFQVLWREGAFTVMRRGDGAR